MTSKDNPCLTRYWRYYRRIWSWLLKHHQACNAAITQSHYKWYTDNYNYYSDPYANAAAWQSYNDVIQQSYYKYWEQTGFKHAPPRPKPLPSEAQVGIRIRTYSFRKDY